MSVPLPTRETARQPPEDSPLIAPGQGAYGGTQAVHVARSRALTAPAHEVRTSAGTPAVSGTDVTAVTADSPARGARHDLSRLAALSVLALLIGDVYVARHGMVLRFADASSHMTIPRRLWDNGDTGWGQLGTHWAPLLHVLIVPFTLVWPLYTSGLAGTIVSSLAALVCVIYTFRLAHLISSSRIVAWCAALALLAGPDFLYSAAIPMLPMLLMATVVANVYHLARWASSGSGLDMIAAGLWLSAAMLTHFEAWVLAPLETALVVVLAHRRWHDRERTQACGLLWGLVAGYGGATFVLMNVLIYGDPLSFLRTSDGSPSVFGTAHHGLSALADYPHAVWSTLGPAGCAVLLGGTAAYAVRTRLRPEALPVLLLLFPCAWFTFQAVSSGSIIVPGDDLGSWRNLRYATTILPAASVLAMIGSRARWAAPLTLVLVLAGYGVMLARGEVAAWEDAVYDTPSEPAVRLAGDWLGRYSDSQTIAVPSPQNYVDRLELDSHLPESRFIDANDTAPYSALLRDPGRTYAKPGVGWIVWISPGGDSIIRRHLRVSHAQLCMQAAGAVESGHRVIVRIYGIRGCARGSMRFPVTRIGPVPASGRHR